MAGWAREEGRTTQTPQHPVRIHPRAPANLPPGKDEDGQPQHPAQGVLSPQHPKPSPGVARPHPGAAESRR